MLKKKEFIFASIIIIGLTIIILYYISDGKIDDVNNNVDIPPATSIPATFIQPATDIEIDTNIYREPYAEPIIISPYVEPKIEEPVVKLEDEKFSALKKALVDLKNEKNVNIFNDMISLNSVQINTYFNIDMNKIESFIVRMSSSKFESSMYIIMKPINGYKEELISLIKNYMSSYEKSWMYMNEAQYDIVVNRKAIERNGYVIYVLSTDNSIVLDEIRKLI